MNREQLPSEGWSPLMRYERGQASNIYDDLAAAYGQTSEWMGEARRALLRGVGAGTPKGATRDDILHEPETAVHIQEALGSVGIGLYGEYYVARDLNLEAMLALRAEDNRIYEEHGEEILAARPSPNQPLVRPGWGWK